METCSVSLPWSKGFQVVARFLFLLAIMGGEEGTREKGLLKPSSGLLGRVSGRSSENSGAVAASERFAELMSGMSVAWAGDGDASLLFVSKGEELVDWAES